MKIFRKKSVWVLLSSYLCLWLVVALVAGSILESYKGVLNATLGLTGYRTETVSAEDGDYEYFKSNFVQTDEEGNILYKTDADGYVHQVYDDVALREAALEKANQVQREGTTILWNSETNGLPLEKNDKVSLFSHSSVDWVYSGGGSGGARVNGASDMKEALTAAGLEVNPTLWSFYTTGAGKDYVRTARFLINEVPWSKYTETVKNSFSTYGDAAIIVLSRQAGEGSVAQGGAFDVTQTEADTPSGDYYDMSAQERKLLEEVIAAKKAGIFSKVIVLLNTPTDMWFAPIFEFKENIDSCLWVGQTGYQGLNEIGKILVGDSIPSGHLVDTFLLNTQSNPAFVNSTATMYLNAQSMELKNLGFQGMYITYAEGIYVGYKYYETRYEDAVLGQGNADSTAGAVNSAEGWNYSEEVAFPFGYGGSYTTFEYSNYDVKLNADGNYEVTLTVTNSGSEKGADAVQIYVQKPYTDYDRQWGIEQAAVNLAGYAKTKELAPGESVTVTIVVDDDAFKTYDANNKKTYIREKTNGFDAYYITAAQDAHEAVNNILAAKGKTPENTNGVMDAAGTASLVKKFEFDTDDYETYSKSEVTGQEITNQFDDTDWNKYENKTEATLTYLSRNDWEATYPKETVKLTMNEKMVDDLTWDKLIAADPNDQMPLFGQEHTLNLIDMKGLEYNNSAWDTLLNQLTLDEMIKLVGTGYHGTKDISSIAKPAEVTKDGPLGVKQPYQTNSTEYTLSFPSTTLLAASYNDQLAQEVGELMGEDMLHAGVTGIYAPGANIHRMTYSGRNYEYYSEDGFVTGMMTKYQVIGIQSTGCYVNIKHIALNDQEDTRHGVNIWANEQAIREVYLQAFEYVVKDGECTGLMSAFNRLGTKWSGSHKGLLTNVLRGEWGFEGFVISDCAWREYMGVVDGLMAGNDCILDTVDLTLYDQAKTNPTVAKALRESVHRVLYVVVNSNAMNGINSNTRIYEVKEWWQVLVTNVQIGLGIVTGIFVLITVLIFVFQKNTRSDENPAATAQRTGKGMIRLCLCTALGVLVIATAATVPAVLAKEPMDLSSILEGKKTGDGTEVPDGENTDDSNHPVNSGKTEVASLKELLEGTLTDYRFEAECAELKTDIAGAGAGLPGGKLTGDCNFPSGGGMVYNLGNEGDATITFHITAEEDTKAVLSICLGRINVERDLLQLFKITVNGKECRFASDIAFDIFEGTKYYDWQEREAAIVELQKGENTIEFTKVYQGLNFDYITLTSAAGLQDTREAENGGHSYGDWNVVTAPTLENPGSIGCYCEICRAYLEEELPVVSEENGYEKTILKEATETTFGSARWSYTKNGTTFSFGTMLYPESENVQSYLFEAEKAGYSGDAKRYSDSTCDASGNAYLGKLAGSTWTMTLSIDADRDCEALLLMRVGRRNDRAITFSGKVFKVNGEETEISSDVVFPQIESESKYLNWEEFEIVVVSLKEGTNEVTLSNTGKAFTNIDYVRFLTVGELSWHVEE